MIEEIRYHFSVSNNNKVIRLSDKFLGIKGNSRNLEVLTYKAQSHKNLFQDQQAIETFKLITEYFPNNLEATIELALCLIDIGEFQESNMLLTEALRIDKTNLEIINNLIFIQEQLHNYEEVIRLSNLAIGIDEKDPSIWLTISSAYDSLGKFEKSIKYGKQALQLCDDTIYLQMAHNNLGFTYSKMNELQLAKTHLEKAIQIDNTEPYAFNNLGLVLAKIGNIEKGFEFINYSLKIDNENSYAFKNRAKLYLMEGKIQKAKNDLKRAKELDYEIEYDNEVNELLAKL